MFNIFIKFIQGRIVDYSLHFARHYFIIICKLFNMYEYAIKLELSVAPDVTFFQFSLALINFTFFSCFFYFLFASLACIIPLLYFEQYSKYLLISSITCFGFYYCCYLNKNNIHLILKSLILPFNLIFCSLYCLYWFCNHFVFIPSVFL